MREPNLRSFSAEEKEAIIDNIMALIEAGKNEEADALHRTLPLPAEYLQTLKEHIGLEALIENGINLSTAVERYGQNWLIS